MRRLTDERGVALIAALLVTMLMSAMLAGFLVMVNADQAAGGIDRDQTQAYAAAHAGVEKLTADLGQEFLSNFSPTAAQLAGLTTSDMEPNLAGIRYLRPDDSSGYRITFEPDANGNPSVADPNGTPINAPPHDGLVGLITPYQVEVTARTTGNAEVRMRRTMQTIAIPVFQFGLFSENNLSFFAGPNFSFGGRVHTNQHLFLKQDDGATLTLRDRVTAVGEVIRTRLSNGVNSHDGTVRMAKAPNCPAAPASFSSTKCFNLLSTHGSLVGTLGSDENDPTWTNVSVGSTNGWLKNGRTGARRLDLPITSDGATPVDLIRRPDRLDHVPPGEAPTSTIGRQRFYNMATLRILMSDQASDLTSLPGVEGTPVRLAGSLTPVGVTGGLTTSKPFAASSGVLAEGFRTTLGTPSIDGYILINRQDRDGNWTDVTMEILSLGFAGRRLSDGNIDVAHLNNNCLDVHPNAVIRVQRVKDTPTSSGTACDTSNPVNADASPGNEADYWPNVLYDAREGMLRDDEDLAEDTVFTGSSFGTVPNRIYNGQNRMFWAGVIHYVELDVRNLRRWLRGEIGNSNDAACIDGGGGDTCAMDVTGFVVYFSDRRTNRDLGADGAVEASYGGNGFVYTDDQETGEFGFEDIINPGSSSSEPNDDLDGAFVDAQGQNRFAEDINARDDRPGNPYVPSLDTYGGWARLVPGEMLNVTGNYTPASNQYRLFTDSGRPIDRNVARVNRAFFFRRALKLVNGGRGNLPSNGSQGLTVTAENPVYIQGNYNACVTSTTLPTNGNSFEPACTGGVGFGTNPGTDHVSAAVIADAVTFLSNAWNDIRSFVNPHDADITGTGTQDARSKYNARQASTTWYRLAIIAGKGLSFTRPTNNSNDHEDFGTDGGAHNFIRYIETWNDENLNYIGSLVSFYSARQAVGIYKCCNIVYGPPTRGYSFDAEFLTPSLLPPRTPMFRDINTLTFRQILRPTQ